MTRPMPHGVPYENVAVMLPTAVADTMDRTAYRAGYGHDRGARQHYLFDLIREANARSDRGEPLVNAEREQP